MRVDEIRGGDVVVDPAIQLVCIHAKKVSFLKGQAAGVTPEAVDVEEELPGFHD